MIIRLRGNSRIKIIKKTNKKISKKRIFPKTIHGKSHKNLDKQMIKIIFPNQNKQMSIYNGKLNSKLLKAPRENLKMYLPLFSL